MFGMDAAKNGWREAGSGLRQQAAGLARQRKSFIPAIVLGVGYLPGRADNRLTVCLANLQKERMMQSKEKTQPQNAV